MGIFNYISDKKAKFQGQIDARRSQVLDAKKNKLAELENKNKKLNEELKLNRAIQKEEQTLKDARKENFKSTFAGKIATNIKAKVNKDKKKNKNNYSGTNENIFTQKAKYNNPFNRK
jgi:hypothetical protein